MTIDRIDGPSVAASNIRGVLRFAGATALELRIAEVSIAGHTWRDVRVACPDLKREKDDLVCAQAVMEAPVKAPLSFRYSTLSKNLDLTFKPAAGEEWRLTLESHAAARTLTLAVSNGLLTRLNAWRPADWPQVTAGAITGTLVVGTGGETTAKADMTVADFGFADGDGLHAGEKIAAVLSLQAAQRGERWAWQGRVEWKNGDVFWQPLFASGGGHVLDAAGVLDADRITAERGNVALNGIGGIGFDVTFERRAGRVVSANLKGAGIDVAALYAKLLQPMLQGTALGDLRCDGRTDFAIEVKDGTVVAADVAFKRVSIEDKSRRFGLFGIDGNLPWRSDRATTAQLRLAGGEILQLPFGAFELPLAMQGLRLQLKQVQIPLLDGKLIVNDFDADGARGDWRWRFSGAIAPLSVQQMTTGLGLPVMHGALSAVIPTVTYQQSTLKVDGALLFKVFDGTIVVRNLVLENPLGQVPRLVADADMRNLDLDLLTRAFSFGSITGRVDAEVKALELINWEPVHFDAHIRSSTGRLPAAHQSGRRAEYFIAGRRWRGCGDPAKLFAGVRALRLLGAGSELQTGTRRVPDGRRRERAAGVCNRERRRHTGDHRVGLQSQCRLE